jgi:ERCC4-type nuclease
MDLGLPAIGAQLAFGDVAWTAYGGQPVGVELKNVADLIGSLRSNRLPGHQLPGLSATYAERWLFVEGTWRVNNAGMICLPGVTDRPRMSVGELEERVQTMRGTGLQVRHTPDRHTTLHALACLYRWYTDKAHDAHVSHLVHYEPVARVSQFRRTVMTLPAVGAKTSAAVEAHFGTLRQAFGATATAWMSVEGIGAKTAARIEQALDGR